MRSLTKGISNGVVRPAIGRPGASSVAAANPIDLAEDYGLGYFSVRESGFWVAGSGAGAGKVYQHIDQTPSVHVGTRTALNGATSATLPAIATDSLLGIPTMNLPAASATYFLPQIGFPQILVLAFRFPDALINAAITNVVCGSRSGAYRPTVEFLNDGTWTYTQDGGASTNTTNQAEGSNVNHAGLGSTWHVLAMYHGTAAQGGLMLDLDGKQLIPNNASFTTTDPALYGTTYWVMANDDNLASTVNVNRIQYGDMAIRYSPSGDQRAQVREIAEAMMTLYGITSLA